MASATAKPADEPPERATLSVDVRIPHGATWIAARDGQHALYELHLTNSGSRALRVERIDALAEDGATVLRTYADAPLTDVLARADRSLTGADKALLAPGQSAVAFIELIAASNAPPKHIRHRLVLQPVETAASEPQRFTLSTHATTIADKPRRIGAPVQGAGWIAANGLANASDHRRTLMTLGGRSVIAQRYAIDFIQVGPNGRLVKDQRGENDSFHCYGAPLLAVADGVVESIRDGLPDNRPLSSTMAVPITADTLAGNFVLLDIGGAQVLYGHVMPGSISVKSGQHVRRGQVLARLGNSGNSDAPHLHLHVIDHAPAHVPATVAPLAGEGIAFAFRGFNFQGRIDDLDAFIASDQRWAPDARGARPMSGLPLAGDVIAFD